MKKALIMTWSGFQDQEVIYPYYRLQEEGFEVSIMSDKMPNKSVDMMLYKHPDLLPIADRLYDNKVVGIFGIGFETNYNYNDLYFHFVDDFSLLVLPGGVKALEKLRQQTYVLEFIKNWNEKKKIIASTCHGAQLLISSKIIKGRKISGYYSIKNDIENAGGIYVDEPAVIDDNIISSPHYKHMGMWMKETIRIYNNFNGD